MNTHSYLPTSWMQKFMQFPLTKLITGFLMIFLPVAIGQAFLMSLPLSGLWRGLLVAAFILPAAYGGYYVLAHFIERRHMANLAHPAPPGRRPWEL